MDYKTKIIHSRQNETMTLRSLIREISGNLQQTIRLNNPESIENAICYIIIS